MRKLLHCRRGAVAFATVIALVPLIGVVALGAEAGSWYVTKQHAQNAADAAAYSGALTVACLISGSGSCDTTRDYVYRGKQFAAQNSFCNAGDSSYPGAACATLATNVSQSVTVDRGNWAAGAWTSSASGNYVRAVVQQTQPAYLAAVLGLTTVNVGAQAIAFVDKQVKKLCGLGLGPSANALTLGGSLTLGAGGCGLQSDTSVKFNSTPTVTGDGWGVYGASGCSPSGACSDPSLAYNYAMPPANDPLQGLQTASFSLAPGTQTPCVGVPKCTTYSPGSFNKLTVNAGDIVHFNPGVYSFSGNISITGGTVDCPSTVCTCVNNPTATSGTSGVNIIITGSAKLTINGGTVKLCAGTNNTGSQSALNGVLIDDQATGAVSISGNAGTNPVALEGAIYAPKTDVTLNGTSSFANNTCSEVIGETLTLTGNAYMSTSNCVSTTIPWTQLVMLVQ